MLFRGLLIIGTNRECAWELVTKVALDSMPALRRNVLTMMLDNPDTLDWKTKELAEDLGYPTNTTRRVLEDLNCYGIVWRMDDGNADIWKNVRLDKKTPTKLLKSYPKYWKGIYNNVS